MRGVRVALAAVLLAASARAQVEAEPSQLPPPGPAPAPVVAAPEPPTAKGTPSAPRDMPDYDARGDEPTTAGQVLLWVPRVALSPLYLTSEYVIRRPLGALITTAEQKQ